MTRCDGATTIWTIGHSTRSLDAFLELLELSAKRRATLMCAEAVWWRCHRALIADVLRVRGIEVAHILDAEHCVPHPYTSPARIVEGRLSYSQPP